MMWPFNRGPRVDLVLHNGERLTRRVRKVGQTFYASIYCADQRVRLLPDGEVWRLPRHNFVEAWDQSHPANWQPEPGKTAFERVAELEAEVVRLRGDLADASLRVAKLDERIRVGVSRLEGRSDA
jgi:hypothetical protein